MGHSKRIAQKHYLQVTEADFKQATENPTQNAAQHMHVMPRIDSQRQNTAHEKRLSLPSNASSRDTVQPSQVGDEGLELRSVSKWKITDVVMRDAESDAFPDVHDRKLQALLQAWAGLPESVKDALLVMVSDRSP